ncbi:hypothetical protein MTO96_006226 [Rhipicephalus appendiculatus]
MITYPPVANVNTVARWPQLHSHYTCLGYLRHRRRATLTTDGRDVTELLELPPIGAYIRIPSSPDSSFWQQWLRLEDDALIPCFCTIQVGDSQFVSRTITYPPVANVHTVARWPQLHSHYTCLGYLRHRRRATLTTDGQDVTELLGLPPISAYISIPSSPDSSFWQRWLRLEDDALIPCFCAIQNRICSLVPYHKP